jgi:hypothetical protein
MIMGLLRKTGGLLIVAGAALVGNWVGDNLRAVTSGEPGHQLSMLHTNAEGHTVVGLNLALTNFIPTLLLALLAGKPRALYAFVCGAIVSALIGDGYERAVGEWLRRRIDRRRSVGIGC